MTRRDFLYNATLASAAAPAAHALQAALPLAGPVTVVRKVAEGDLRGTIEGNLQVFRGVPFAQPPVGPLRFRAPLPGLPWTGVRDATRFAPAAMQPGEDSVEQSEDCLCLNVWAPASGGVGGPYPVFVWVHGGGFTGGRSSEAQFAGSHFADAGVVCITVAYRLGVLGFLDVSPLLGEGYRGSANNGLRDVMAALSWVQRNVAAFGGDPARVTLGGESAGAKLSDLLLGTPSASGLFHQVISESGGAERIAPAATAADVGRGFGKAWTQKTQAPVGSLLTAPARELIDVQQRFTRDWPMHFPLRPELDGGLIPATPLTTLRDGAGRGKRILIGTNRDESALFLGPHPRKAVAAVDLGNMPLAQFGPLAQRYGALYPELSDEQREIRSVTAEEYWIPSLRVAEAAVQGGAEAFVYRLDYPGTDRYRGLAFHSYDLRFVWNSFGKDVPTTAQQQLAVQMHAAWIAFVQGRAPAAAGLPVWPRYDLATRATLLFNQLSVVVSDPSQAERKLWDGLLNA